MNIVPIPSYGKYGLCAIRNVTPEHHPSIARAAQATFSAVIPREYPPIFYKRATVITLDELRETFIRYFVDHDHLRVGESSLLPKEDPTLLFINSGMAAMKTYFLGTQKPPQPELCNSQLCLRTNDIDDIGDMHHLTLFEMLGSWSIGGRYFKEGAIELAFDLLINQFKFPCEHIYATIYAGDAKLGIPYDQESHEAWLKVGLSGDHIVPLGEDNLWGPAGDTGPCGPCTEVFFDMASVLGESIAPPYQVGNPNSFDTKRRYMEIWNAGVFMQYNKTAEGAFEPLPVKSVYTGSGLERLCMAINGYSSVYDTDILHAVMQSIKQTLGSAPIPDTTIRMMTDHLRAATFVLAERIAPGSGKQNYIPRKLIRKVLAAGFAATGRSIDFSPTIAGIIEMMGIAYPRLQENRNFILNEYAKEASAVCRILVQARTDIEKILAKRSVVENGVFSGTHAQRLKSEKGVPMEVTQAILGVRGISLDLSDYYRADAAHKMASKPLKK